jgi:hypothetical protein
LICARGKPFDGVPAIVQPVFVDDPEIESRLGIAASGGMKVGVFHVKWTLDIRGPCRPSWDRATPFPVVGKGDAFQVSARLEA